MHCAGLAPVLVFVFPWLFVTTLALRDEFRSSPQNTWVAQGETAILECEPPRGNPEPKVLWKKNGNPIDVKANGRYRILGLGSLSISQVRPNDEGRYVCSARNIVGIRQSSAALLRVTVRPQFTIVPANTSALLGSDISLACVARGDPPPEITWKKQRGTLPLKRAHFDEERFLISNASEEDAGIYACIAENKAGSIVSSASVTILAPPTLTVTPQSLEIQPNSTAFLRCEAGSSSTDSTRPTLFWSREGSHSVIFQGSKSSGGENIRVGVDGTLQIDSVGERDEGRYFCAAVTPAGSAMHKVELKVTPLEELPPPIINIGPSNQTRPMGSVAIMPCVAEGNPTPVITWYKNTNSFHLDHRIFTDDAGTLRINDLRKEDSGLYECVASSPSGKYVWRAYLTVESATNPSVVFRRTGFEIDPRGGVGVGQRPREPMKPHIVNVDSTSVTIAWHPKYFRFSATVENENDFPDRPDLGSSGGNGFEFDMDHLSKSRRGESSTTFKKSLKDKGLDEDDDDDIMLDDEFEPGRVNDIGGRADSDSDTDILRGRARAKRSWQIGENRAGQSETSKSSSENEFVFRQLKEDDDKNEEGDTENVENEDENQNVSSPPFNEDENEGNNEESDEDSEDFDEDKEYREEKIKFQEAIHEIEEEEEHGNSGQEFNNLIIRSSPPTSKSKYPYFRKPEPETTTTGTTTTSTSGYFAATTTTTTTTTTPEPPVSPPSQVTYKVEYYSADELRSEWILGATNVPIEIFTLQYLKPATEYVFFVRSVSPEGYISAPSPLSDRVVTTHTGNKQGSSDLTAARAKLDALVVVLLKHAYPTSSTSIRIEWQIVNAGEFIEGFYIYFRPVEQRDEGSYQMLTVLNTGTSTFQIAGLDKFTAYQIFLLPFYKNVDGRPSNYINVTTIQDVPSAPPELLDPIPVNATALVVRWRAPPLRHQNGIILGYQLRVWSGQALVGNMTTNGSTSSLLLNNLTGGQSYSLQIGSFTSKGAGAFSSMKTLHFRPDNDNRMTNVIHPSGGGIGGKGKGGKGGINGKPYFDGTNINFGNEIDESAREVDGEFERGDDGGLTTFGATATSNHPQNDFLTEAWFIGLIGSVIFIMLSVFVFMLYIRRCQLRRNGDKLKVSTTEIPDGSMPPHYPEDNLWIDSQQTKQHSLKSVKTNNDMNEYENANNYAVVEDRHSPIPYATTTLVNGEKHVRKSSFSVFGESMQQSQGGKMSGYEQRHGGSRPNDFGMMGSPKMVGWATTAVPAPPPPNNKTASLNICSQDMKKSWFPLTPAPASTSSSPHSRRSSFQSKSKSKPFRQPGVNPADSEQQEKFAYDQHQHKETSESANGETEPFLVVNSQDMGKGASLNVLTTFQTPLPGRKHIVVDFSNGQSINSILHYHEPRLTNPHPINQHISHNNYNSHNSHSSNGHSNHNAF